MKKFEIGLLGLLITALSAGPAGAWSPREQLRRQAHLALTGKASSIATPTAAARHTLTEVAASIPT